MGSIGGMNHLCSNGLFRELLEIISQENYV